MMTTSALEIRGVTATNISFIENDFGDGNVRIAETISRGILTFKSCAYNDCAIDIASSELESLNLDQDLIDFVDDPRIVSPLFSPKMTIGTKIETLKKLKNMFSTNHLYPKEDAAFYMLKSLEAKRDISRQRHIHKLLPAFFYLIGRFVLGWGVKLRPPFLFSILTILIFSIVFHFQYDFYLNSAHVSYMSEQFLGVNASLLVSILTFFGQHSGITVQGHTIASLHIVEFVIGLIMSVLMTGILIRKLVR